MSDEYNGWPNYETWNLNLWTTNEPGPYEYVEKHKPFTADKAEQVARELWPHGTPDMDGPGDLEAVDWERIAEAWNADD